MTVCSQSVRGDTNRRLLFICNGADYFVAHWRVRALAAVAAGFEVAVAVPDPPDNDKEPWTWLHNKVDRRKLGLASNWTALRRTRALIESHDPALVISITMKPNLYSALAIHFGQTRPLVMNVTGLGFLFLSSQLRVRWARMFVVSVLRLCTNGSRVWMVYENDEDRREFLSAGIGVEERALLLGGAGVDLDSFTPTAEPVTAEPLVVLPARLLWDKGVGEFVEAARILRARGVAARFALVGSIDAGNPSAVPQAILDRWCEEGNVEWWGFQANMPAILASATIVCLPSYREGLPRALLEAAAAQRAIVTTDAPGCRQIVEDHVSGRLVPSRDADSLADVLQELLADPVTRRKLGAAARAMVEERYSEEFVVAHTVSLYRRAAGQIGAGQDAHSPSLRSA